MLLIGIFFLSVRVNSYEYWVEASYIHFFFNLEIYINKPDTRETDSLMLGEALEYLVKRFACFC